ncbi:hypothetical protein [Streptomyces sp. BH105]|uniref:hypothetical protein n=1 Tax=Streptomyces sp. BH105 TaxID=3410408 RepID=UPI003CEB738C
MSDRVFAAIVAAIAALATGCLTYAAARKKIEADTKGLITQLGHNIEQLERQISANMELQEQRLRTELRTQFMAEEAIRELLNRAQPKRSFEVIKDQVGGFNDNELRQLLVRAGAIRFYGANRKEWWGLRERNWPELKKVR